mgnify:CR=1 FL=1
MLLCVGDAPATTEQNTRDFLTTNSLFHKGKYEEALKGYAQLIDHYPNNGHLYYNQGNVYLRLGQLGAALAAYRQALVYLPRHQDLKANLAYARSLTKDDILPLEPHPLLRTLFFWHYSFNLIALGIAFLLINFIFWLTMLLRLYWRQNELLRWSMFASLLFVISFALSITIRHFAAPTIALVNAPEIEVYAANRVDSVVRFKLHAGSEVAVVAENNNWLRIRISDTEQGWLEKDNVILVNL